MARARNIKPGFFKNEDLAECQPFTRLCFAGLWIMADREGRLEDRPKRIKGELFPYDTVDVEPLLRELEKHGFIQRYIVGDLAVIQILQFGKHQTPHFKEAPSTLPPRQSPGFDPHSMNEKPEASPPLNEPEAQGEPSANPVLAPPDSGFSDSLIPDSGINTSGTSYLHPPAVRLNGSHSAGLPGIEPPPPGLPDCPHAKVRELWATLMPELQQPAKWSEARAAALRSRWREEAAEQRWATEDDGLRVFAKLFRWCRRSDFLMGKAPTQPGRAPFSLTLPWLIKAENWAKVQEGNYHSQS